MASQVTVLYGPASDGKNQEIFAKCLEKIRRREGRQCLYLVRSDVRARQLRDEILRERSGCFSMPVWTLPEYSRWVYRHMPSAQNVLNELEQKILVQHILSEREQVVGQAFYFNQFIEQPGIVSKVNDFFNTLRRAGIASSQELADKLASCQASQRPIRDELVTLYDYYTNALKQAQSIDETGIVLEMGRRAVSGEFDLRGQFSVCDLLVLEGYSDLLPPEQQIFSAMCSQFEQTFLTLDLPFNPYNLPEEQQLPRPFHLFRPFVQYIRESGFSVRQAGTMRNAGIPAGERQKKKTSLQMDWLAGSQNAGKMPALQMGALQDMTPVTITPCRSRKEEVVDIARTIRRLSRENHIQHIREIGVTFPLLEHYDHLIREIFPRYGIPFTIFQGFSLGASPVIVTIFRMLSVILEGYSPESIRHFFSSPLVEVKAHQQPAGIPGGQDVRAPNSTELGGSDDPQATSLRADTYHRLDDLARKLEIFGGRHEWSAKLTAYQHEQEERCASDEDSASPQTELAKSLLPAFFDFVDILADFEAAPRRPVKEFIDLLRQALQRFHIPQRILLTQPRTPREHNVAALRSFLTLLETVEQNFALAQRLSASHSGQEARAPKRMTFRAFYDLLRVAVQGQLYDLPQMLDDSVFVMGRLDARQVQCRYLFFGGLLEKDFPGVEAPNIFLTDQEAESLGVPASTRLFQETAHLFYLHTSFPTEHVYLSYPLQEDEKDVLPSTYIEQVKTFYEESSQPPPVAAPHETAHLEDIHTSSELYQWIGRQAAAIPDALTAEEAAFQDVFKFLEHEKGTEALRHVLHGIQTQQQRAGSDILTPYNGVLASQWATRRLKERYAHHIYSASEFDLYARCPVKFLFQRLLRLEPLPVPIRGMSASEFGTLVHTIVYRFYTGAQKAQPGEADQEFLRRKADKIQWKREARRRMSSIARDEMTAYDLSGAFGSSISRELLAGLQEEENSDDAGQQGILASFIELDANDPDAVQPRYLEAHFGMPHLSQEEHDEAGIAGYLLSDRPFTLQGRDRDGAAHTIHLRGEVDRIDVEISQNGNPAGGRKLVIYEYKTGSVPPVKKIKEGRFFQIPLYLSAVQELFGESYQVIAGGYYQLASPQETGKKSILGSKEHARQHYFKSTSRTLFETYQEFRALLEEYANRAVCAAQDMRQGRFHPTLLGEQEAGCRYCEYRQICRVDHQRMKHPGLFNVRRG